MSNRTYLGNAVYAYFDGDAIELATGSHDKPENFIYLERDVIRALLKFCIQNKVLSKQYVVKLEVENG